MVDASNRRPFLYLAGPSVFDRHPLMRGHELKKMCELHGAVGLYPMDNEIGRVPDPAGAIFAANMELIRRCDAVVADMSPFRGPSMDPGTAFEMGAASICGKPVVGYTRDPRPYVERVCAFTRVEREADGALRDPEGMSVEDFGVPLADNLMMARSAAAVFGTADEAVALAVRLAVVRLTEA